MLYYLHNWMEYYSPLRVFQYITVRTILGAGIAFLLTAILAPAAIRRLRRLGARQYERKEHVDRLRGLRGDAKEGTPTMGGALIVGAIVIATLLCANLGNVFVWLALATLLYMGLVGFWDDYTKVCREGSHGLSARKKTGWQALWALAMAGFLLTAPETRASVRNFMVPFFSDLVIQDLGPVLAAAFVILILIGASNAVNLTDGLDGLAVGCSSTVAATYLIMAYVAGHAVFAQYLIIPYVPGSGELAVFCGCMLGACFGFLWHNCHPARVFMGDTGSLALGGGIGIVAILIKQELALIVVGGVFVMEAASVIVQVLSFRFRGKRVFAMAPLHHHFELRHWSETQVTVRFWILSAIFALLGILTLKIR